MRMISGSILLLAAEQAFAHSLSVGFPNAATAQDILYPASMLFAGFGILLLAWGLWAGEFVVSRDQTSTQKS